MLELILLIAIAYAGARGLEKITSVDRRYDTEEARTTVAKIASSGPKEHRPARKPPGPTEPGGTFSAIAPRSAALGAKAAYPVAVLAETSATMWKAIGEGYRERWPEAREERRRKMTERARERQRRKEEAAAKREQAEAQRKAQQARDQAGPPPPYPPRPTEPPKPVELTKPDDADGAGTTTKAAGPQPADTESGDSKATAQTTGRQPTPQQAKPLLKARPAGRRRYLTVVPDPDPTPNDTDEHAEEDPMSPTTVIPEIRTLDGLINALTLTRAMCEMRAEEALAVAADDKALSDRLDQLEAELAELEVDDGTRAEINELRDLIHAQSEAAIQYGAAAKDAADFATATAQAAYKAHGGIAEAVQSSPIEVAAQAGYYQH